MWIDVKHQLPQDGEVVDVWMQGKKNKIIGYRLTNIRALVIGGELMLQKRNDLIIHSLTSVITHWAPVPAPPIRY